MSMIRTTEPANWKWDIKPDLKKGNEVHEELEELLHKWSKGYGRELERLVWSGTTWENENAYFNTEKLQERKQQITDDMTTLYKTDNEHLRKAFIEELKELGYEEKYEMVSWSIVYTKDNYFSSCAEVSMRSEEATKTFNLKTQWNEALQHASEQLQPKFESGDKVVFVHDCHSEGVCEVKEVKDNGKIVIITNNYGICTESENDLRKPTQEEIEQATRKTFFDWEVTEKGSSTKIGCQSFDNSFLKDFADAVANLGGNVTISELRDELDSIGYIGRSSDLPF